MASTAHPHSPLVARIKRDWDDTKLVNPAFNNSHRTRRLGHPSHEACLSNRVPYFRYFGPTAIVPGFKQMVVSAPGPSSYGSLGRRISHFESKLASLGDLPSYDQNDPEPVPTLIIKLVKLFFFHIGANFPFWKEDKFLRLVQEKRMDPILVDSVCALAARYNSDFASFNNGRLKKWEYGNIFARRAKERVPDLFAVPSVGTVQGFLLLAYEAFGSNQDSALWMYLGCSIRMALDIGLDKMIGVQYQGEKDPWNVRNVRRPSDQSVIDQKDELDDEILSPAEQREVEKERIDTFWSILVLDRAVSAGTGRIMTLRENDIELPLPGQNNYMGWPDPYPAFVQILHLYGRALDVLNKIEKPEDLTDETAQQLAKMESDLTHIYHKQDHRLRFDATNFSEHARLRQAPAFILLHLWFHALIIILHQPTLLKPFRNNRMHQLPPTSHELAMSSAKSIADILAFSDLVDPNSCTGIPFTSQPMYIAACAFLELRLSPSQQASHESTPPFTDSRIRVGTPGDLHSSKQHSVLLSNANDNYKRCYTALQKLRSYWGGVGYILTALDQKSKGIWDCETYTMEEYESTKTFRRASNERLHKLDAKHSPIDPPIAYSLTGTTNSPNPSVTRLLFQAVSHATAQPQLTFTNTAPTPIPAPPNPPIPSSVAAPTPPGNMIYDPIRQSLPNTSGVGFPRSYTQAVTSEPRHSINQSKNQNVSTPLIEDISGPSAISHSLIQYDNAPIAKNMDSSPNIKLQILRNMTGPSSTSTHYHAYTPTSQHSSTYEAPSIISGTPKRMSGAYAENNRHLSCQSSQVDVNATSDTISRPTVKGTEHIPGEINHESEFVDAGLTSGSYFSTVSGPFTGVLSFDCQEVDISSLALPGSDMSAWYLPMDVVGCIEAGASSENG